MIDHGKVYWSNTQILKLFSIGRVSIFLNLGYISQFWKYYKVCLNPSLFIQQNANFDSCLDWVLQRIFYLPIY